MGVGFATLYGFACLAWQVALSRFVQSAAPQFSRGAKPNAARVL